MGHTTANLTLAIYARQMDRRDGEPDRLRALANGDDLAQLSLRPAIAGGHPLARGRRRGALMMPASPVNSGSRRP